MKTYKLYSTLSLYSSNQQYKKKVVNTPCLTPTHSNEHNSYVLLNRLQVDEAQGNGQGLYKDGCPADDHDPLCTSVCAVQSTDDIRRQRRVIIYWAGVHCDIGVQDSSRNENQKGKHLLETNMKLSGSTPVKILLTMTVIRRASSTFP